MSQAVMGVAYEGGIISANDDCCCAVRCDECARLFNAKTLRLVFPIFGGASAACACWSGLSILVTQVTSGSECRWDNTPCAGAPVDSIRLSVNSARINVILDAGTGAAEAGTFYRLVHWLCNPCTASSWILPQVTGLIDPPSIETACSFPPSITLEVPDQNEIQRIALFGTVTSGFFSLTFDGQTTSDLLFNATADDIQTALEALSNIVPGDVICTGGPLAGIGASPVNIEFTGSFAAKNVPSITAVATFVCSDVCGVAITVIQNGNPLCYP